MTGKAIITKKKWVDVSIEEVKTGLPPGVYKLADVEIEGKSEKPAFEVPKAKKEKLAETKVTLKEAYFKIKEPEPQEKTTPKINTSVKLKPVTENLNKIIEATKKVRELPEFKKEVVEIKKEIEKKNARTTASTSLTALTERAKNSSAASAKIMGNDVDEGKSTSSCDQHAREIYKQSIENGNSVSDSNKIADHWRTLCENLMLHKFDQRMLVSPRLVDKQQQTTTVDVTKRGNGGSSALNPNKGVGTDYSNAGGGMSPLGGGSGKGGGSY